MANLFFVALIVYKAKISYFSIKSIIINYILLPIFYQYNRGMSYGVLESSSFDLHYFEINLFIMIYNILTLFFIYKFNLEKKEMILIRSIDHRNSKNAVLFCSIVAIVCTLLLFPSLPFNFEVSGARLSAVLPGQAWNHFVIVALIYMVNDLKYSNLARFTYAFCIFWFLTHYERVDIVGLIVMLFIVLITQKFSHINLKKIFKITAITIALIVLLNLIGDIRGNAAYNFSIGDALENLIVQNTASDLGYVFNVSIEYYKNNPPLLGSSYITYIIKLLPFMSNNSTVASILNATYGTPGGEYILSEPLMNFGIKGIIIFTFAEFSIYKYLLKKPTKARFIIYLLLICSAFRTSWYGIYYIERALVLFIPFLYIVVGILNSKSIKGNMHIKHLKPKKVILEHKKNLKNSVSYLMKLFGKKDSLLIIYKDKRR
jgi:hypothetical protein